MPQLAFGRFSPVLGQRLSPCKAPRDLQLRRSIVRLCCGAQIPFDSRTIVACLLDWANAALKQNLTGGKHARPVLDEKRGIRREQTLKAGTISLDGSGIDCLVRKMSRYGANLEVESQIGIPNSFDLAIDTGHSNHHCHVVWRKALRIDRVRLGYLSWRLAPLMAV